MKHAVLSDSRNISVVQQFVHCKGKNDTVDFNSIYRPGCTLKAKVMEYCSHDFHCLIYPDDFLLQMDPRPEVNYLSVRMQGKSAKSKGDYVWD